MDERYLGDAVYVSFDGFMLKLRTGDMNQQVIYLEPDVYDGLVKYAKECWSDDEPQTDKA